MKPGRYILAFLVAPLVAYPVAFGGVLVQEILFPLHPGLPLYNLLEGPFGAGLVAVVSAYPMMLFAGMPAIFVLRRIGAFRPRVLEITGAVLGGLPFVSSLLALQDRVPFSGRELTMGITWLLIGTLSGLFAGRAVWFVADEPPPEDAEREVHQHLPAEVSREEFELDPGALPAAGEAALTVLFDVRCALCRRARAWLMDQPKYVPMAFVAAGSKEARRRFPGLDHDSTLEELTVIGWQGEVYRGAKGWVMCLWALKRYRSAALRLSSPEMLPVARRLIAWVSRNRFQIGETAGWTK